MAVPDRPKRLDGLIAGAAPSDGRTDALEIEVPAVADPAVERAAEAELAPCLTAMVGRLAEPYRTAITLTSLQGMTQTDAAKRVGISVSGMKSRVQRGREQLRQMLVRCCAIALDVRGGVSDFHLREAGACGGDAASSESCAPGPCSSSGASLAASKDRKQRLQH